MENRNEALLQRLQAAMAASAAPLHPVVVELAEDCLLWDPQGRDYLDCSAARAVGATGHLHPDVIEAVELQVHKAGFTSSRLLAHEPAIQLCEWLNELVSADFACKTLLCSGAAGALGSALQLARMATGRQKVIAFSRIAGAHNLQALYPDPLRGIGVDEAIASVEAILAGQASPQEVAAILVEPLQGEPEGGVATTEFLQRLRLLCDQHDILLLADERNCAFACSGSWFAMQQMGVAADMILFEGALGAGYPLAGVCGRADLMDTPLAGSRPAQGASPIACAAALAVLELIEEEELLERARAIGECLQSGLQALQAQHPLLASVRGMGSLRVLELCEDGDPARPASARTAELVERAREHGLLLKPSGEHGNLLRIALPLTISQELLDRGLETLGECLSAV